MSAQVLLNLLILCPPREIFHAFLWSANFFQNNFFEKFFQEYHLIVKNRLDPDQAQHFVGPDRFVGPDLVPICLQRL